MTADDPEAYPATDEDRAIIDEWLQFNSHKFRIPEGAWGLSLFNALSRLLYNTTTPSVGADLIAAERARQETEERYTASHDREHGVAVIVAAAESYIRAVHGREAGFLESNARLFGAKTWPWHESFFKPSDTKRDLVKAGALIAAAIDSLQGEGEH